MSASIATPTMTTILRSITWHNEQFKEIVVKKTKHKHVNLFSGFKASANPLIFYNANIRTTTRIEQTKYLEPNRIDPNTIINAPCENPNITYLI